MVMSSYEVQTEHGILRDEDLAFFAFPVTSGVHSVFRRPFGDTGDLFRHESKLRWDRRTSVPVAASEASRRRR